VVEQAFEHGQIETACCCCLEDLDGHTPIIQCQNGHCMHLHCFNQFYQKWSTLKKNGPTASDFESAPEGLGPAEASPYLKCPECRVELANMKELKTYRNKAAEYLFSHDLGI
jgi:hypothetical protein